MNITIFAFIYVICAAAALYIRVIFMTMIGDRKAYESSLMDKLLVILIVASMVAPLVHILTPHLDFANYAVPEGMAWLGVAGIISSLVILWMSHRDLGVNFALTPCVKEGQSLVRKGVYRRVRHPMYTSLWLWAFSMPLLLHNVVAAVPFLVVFGSFYASRVPVEESLMLEMFGEEYRGYMEETGRLLPRFRR